KERLPDYMIPAVFVPLAELPLTTSGKVNRRALPAPPASQATEASQAEAETQVEELVRGAWEQVLGLQGLSRSDNFFAVGGHSLLATQVVSRLRQLFGVEVSVRQLFEAPTIAELAQAIEQQRRAAHGERLAPPILAQPRTDDAGLPLSYAQRRLWFIQQLEADGGSAYHIPLAYQLEGRLQVAALEQSLGEVRRRHEALRTVFAVAGGGEPRQQVQPYVGSRLAMVDLELLGTDEQEMIV